MKCNSGDGIRIITKCNEKYSTSSASNQAVTFTDFKKIKTLTESNKHYILTYGIDDQRRKSEYKINGVTQKTKYYLGDYEEETDNLGNIKKIHYLSGGAILINTNGVETLYYGYSDYQGSLIALANEAGTVVERYAFDPWGKRRNPADWTQDDTRTSWIIDRGYTMHEHLDQFGIINMNGRVYDPLTTMFFSPDPFVQAPGNWLNFNRYAYCYGNPFKYTDPDGEWVWLVFAVYGAWQMGIQAGVAAENNGANFWKDGFWKGALVGFATGALGSIAPLGTEWVGSMAWGAILGTASQAGTVWAMGGNDYSKIWQGALIGGAMGFVSSQQFGNWVGGKGFVNNDQVLKNFSAGKYDVSGFNSWQDAALDYFGFEGKYDPNAPIFQKVGPEPAVTDPGTGEIFYNDFPFQGNFDRLSFTADHEMFHRRNVLSGKYNGVKIDFEVAGKEEWSAYLYGYKNQGLYKNHGFPLNQRINEYGLQGGVYEYTITPTGVTRSSFSEHWWHFLYKIQRRW